MRNISLPEAVCLICTLVATAIAAYFYSEHRRYESPDYARGAYLSALTNAAIPICEAGGSLAELQRQHQSVTITCRGREALVE